MKSLIRRWVLLASPAVTISIGYGLTFDNVNVVKLAVLSIVAGFSAAELILFVRNSEGVLPWASIATVFFFLACMLPSLFLSNSPFTQQFYGTSGRNLGFLHYFFLMLVFLAVSVQRTRTILPAILGSLVLLGIFEALYGLIQYLGLDPLPWKNTNGWIFGTFGNPNYLSSFLAFTSIVTFSRVIFLKGLANRFTYTVFFLLQLITIFLTDSSQGLILLVFGIFSILFISFYTKSHAIAWLLFLFVGIAASFSVLGIFQRGPFQSIIYQDSISFRGDYWRAGMEMFKQNLWYGIGLDSYGDFYRMYRDETAANRRGLGVFSNSAHNIFIDLGATGGIALLLAYLVFLMFVTIKIFTTFRQASDVGLDFKLLVILWACFNLQCIISINVSSLAIWGWVFSGLIVGYGNDKSTLNSKNKQSGEFQFSKLALTCCVLTIALLFPLITRDIKLGNAVKANNYQEIYQVLREYPRDAEQMADFAIVYQKLGEKELAINLAKAAVVENPNSVRSWQVILVSPLASASDQKKASAVLSSLDPFFVDLLN